MTTFRSDYSATVGGWVCVCESADSADFADFVLLRSCSADRWLTRARPNRAYLRLLACLCALCVCALLCCQSVADREGGSGALLPSLPRTKQQGCCCLVGVAVQQFSACMSLGTLVLYNTLKQHTVPTSTLSCRYLMHYTVQQCYVRNFEDVVVH